MTKEIWLNLPVKDVNRSKTFFTQIGFSLNPQFPNTEESASLLIGSKNFVVMLFKEATFKTFTKNELADTKQVSEVLISIDAEDRNDVDEIAKKVEKAGGTLYAKPSEQGGWMYGCGFADPDGHRWNVLYMDMSKMPK